MPVRRSAAEAIPADEVAATRIFDAPRALVFEVNLENSLHARKGHHDTAFGGDGSSAEAGPGATRHDRHATRRRGFDDSRHLLGSQRKHHRVRCSPRRESVILVQHYVFGPPENAFRTEDPGKLSNERIHGRGFSLRDGAGHCETI